MPKLKNSYNLGCWSCSSEKEIERSWSRAEAIRAIQEATADGIRAIKEAGADETVIRLKSLELSLLLQMVKQQRLSSLQKFKVLLVLQKELQKVLKSNYYVR